eukprot:1158187-Pelagomonas_calceolata.AAC.9
MVGGGARPPPGLHSAPMSTAPHGFSHAPAATAAARLLLPGKHDGGLASACACRLVPSSPCSPP